MQLKPINQQVVVVVGASSGIGRNAAKFRVTLAIKRDIPAFKLSLGLINFSDRTSSF